MYKRKCPSEVLEVAFNAVGDLFLKHQNLWVENEEAFEVEEEDENEDEELDF